VAVEQLIALAGALSVNQVRRIESAVAWYWVPFGLTFGGNPAAARAQAIAAGRLAGRGGAIDAAEVGARDAALGSPGGRAARRGWSWAENALAGLIFGVIGILMSALAGMVLVAVAFAGVAIGGGVILLLAESGYVRRRRLGDAAAAAALAVATEDLIDAEAYELLAGPWKSVIRD
jgi:hypothetical protein